MAIPTDVGVRPDGLVGSSNAHLITQVTNLVASLRLLTAKLDADVGVTDTNYNALITDSVIATAPAKLTRAGY